jgi:hypothetical protein
MQYLGNVYIWGSPFVMSRTDAQNGVGIIFKPVFHSRISPPLAKNFATEKVHLLFFRPVNERSNRS